MADDDRDEGRDRGRWREESRGLEWRGDEGFGGGWGNQVPRPHRLGDRNWRGAGDRSGAGREYYGSDSVESPSAAGHGGGAMFGNSARSHGLRQQASHHDPHYHEWRERQIAEFDRDYDEYRRENQSRFDREFSDWRLRRGEQRAAVGRALEHMEVVGSDDSHVGTVDCTRGDRIVLTKGDEASGGIHHSIPCAWIQSVDDKVRLNIDADEARRRWQSENRSRALFEREDLGQRGPHVLNRSFAGTYPDEP